MEERVKNSLRKKKARDKYHKGFAAKGNPATSAARIPIHIKSWFTDPSAPRISVGEI